MWLLSAALHVHQFTWTPAVINMHRSYQERQQSGKLKKYSIREALLEDRNNANNDEFGGTDFLAFATFV
jgi:hypothetical protein